MGHGLTWLKLLPGYQQIEAYLTAQASKVGQGQGFLFGNVISIQHVIAALLVVIVLLIVGLRARADLASREDQGLIPSPRISVLNFIEYALESLYGQMRQIMGGDAKRYFPVVAAFALFIFFSNLLGLVPGFEPPTNNWNTTFACSFFVFLYYNWHGLRAYGLHHIAHMANPIGTWWGWFLMPLLFPIEIISHIARPGSLAIRLSANMVGDHAVITAFLGLVPILIPLPFMVLGLIVCTVQTLVFVLLTTIYIALATADSHEHEKA
ncbi:MAG: F0F1 ATP synthase subunit A [Deltaproteobacteria bacterium]|nr:F0F1 ATP synthase subunit A [Deltaproteobacteria bacterium]